MDEQTGKAGYITRLEAFVDLMRRRKRREILENKEAYLGAYMVGCPTVYIVNGNETNEVTVKTLEKMLDKGLLVRKLVSQNFGNGNINDIRHYAK